MLPIINRGTWARVFGVRQVITRFLNAFADTEGPIQILSLGAGYDILYFWIKDQIASGALPASLKDRVTYVEVDYFDVVDKKIQAIKKSEALAGHIWSSPEEVVGHVPLHDLNASHYKIISADLRETQKL